MATDRLEPFRNQNYLSLETFKRDGRGVQTPVWFVLRENGAFYAYTEAGSWKVKRIRRNSRVRVAPCTWRGNVIGPWEVGRASFVGGEEERTASGLLDRKYFLKKIFNLLARLRRHERVMLRIELAELPR